MFCSDNSFKTFNAIYPKVEVQTSLSLEEVVTHRVHQVPPGDANDAVRAVLQGTVAVAVTR